MAISAGDSTEFNALDNFKDVQAVYNKVQISKG